MVIGLLVFVGGYWVARALQPHAAARALFDDTSSLKRMLLAWLMGLTLALGLAAQAARVGGGAALGWFLVMVAWVLVVRTLMARLASRVALRVPRSPVVRAARVAPAPLSTPGNRALQPALRSPQNSLARAVAISDEDDELWRRAMGRPDSTPAETPTMAAAPFAPYSPRAATLSPAPLPLRRVTSATSTEPAQRTSAGVPSPRRPPAPPSSPPRPRYPAAPNPQLYRLHCRSCGSVLTRPMREYHPRAVSNRGCFRYGRSIAPGTEMRPTQVDVLPGDAQVTDNAVFFSLAELDGAAIPLTWNTSSEGCCGPEARAGANVMCHGCGSWALFFNETCYSPSFYAGRPEEVELRECDLAARHSRPEPARDKEHWQRVALEQPGVVDLSDVMERVLAHLAPRFAEAGKLLDTGWVGGGAVRIDPEITFETVCLLLEHALEVAGGVRLDSNVLGRGVSIRVLCHAPVRSDAEATVPSKANHLARALGGEIHPWRFPDGDFQLVLEIPRKPIPLKPVGESS